MCCMQPCCTRLWGPVTSKVHVAIQPKTVALSYERVQLQRVWVSPDLTIQSHLVLQAG